MLYTDVFTADGQAHGKTSQKYGCQQIQEVLT